MKILITKKVPLLNENFFLEGFDEVRLFLDKSISEKEGGILFSLIKNGVFKDTEKKFLKKGVKFSFFLVDGLEKASLDTFKEKSNTTKFLGFRRGLLNDSELFFEKETPSFDSELNKIYIDVIGGNYSKSTFNLKEQGQILSDLKIKSSIEGIMALNAIGLVGKKDVLRHVMNIEGANVDIIRGINIDEATNQLKIDRRDLDDLFIKIFNFVTRETIESNFYGKTRIMGFNELALLSFIKKRNYIPIDYVDHLISSFVRTSSNIREAFSRLVNLCEKCCIGGFNGLNGGLIISRFFSNKDGVFTIDGINLKKLSNDDLLILRKNYD